MSDWTTSGPEASLKSAAPTGASSMTVMSTVNLRLCDPTPLNEHDVTSIKGPTDSAHNKPDSAFLAIEKMLSWFWKLHPAYDKQTANTRGLILDEIERQWKVLEEAPVKTDDTSVMSHLTEMMGQARSNMNRQEVKKEVKRMKFTMKF